MTLETWGIIVALVVSLAGLALAILKSKPEILKLEAETSEIFQDMLEKEVEKVIARDATIIAMKIRIDFLEAELKQMCNERDDLKDWADRLVKQVVSAGRTPVKMRRRVA